MNDLRVVKTKQALHDALLALLNEKPLEAISIAELCRRARVNRGTFYLHYEHKGMLFEEYFKELMQDLELSYDEPYRSSPSFNVNSLDPGTIRIFHHIEKYKPFYRIVFSKNAPLSYYYLLFDKIHQMMKKNLDRVNRDGLIADYLSAYLSNAIVGIIIEWYKRDFAEPASCLNDQLISILRRIHEVNH